MSIEIWILEKEVEKLGKLIKHWFTMKDQTDATVRYMTSEPSLGKNEWICVHISMNDYITLQDHNILIK